MMALANQHCATIPAGAPPLPKEDVTRLMAEVPSWELQEAALVRTWKFKDFSHSMDFANQVASLAQQEKHHPEICISYNTVKLILSTHKVGGLSMNDFILAAKINQLPVSEE